MLISWCYAITTHVLLMLPQIAIKMFISLSDCRFHALVLLLHEQPLLGLMFAQLQLHLRSMCSVFGFAVGYRFSMGTMSN